jgi:hypothetical protein
MITAIVKVYFMDVSTRSLSDKGKHAVIYADTIEKLIVFINDKYKFDDVHIIKVIYERGENNMKYYKTWQEALIDFIKIRGDNYQVSWSLAEEFEIELQRNRNGTYFMNLGDK